MKWINVNDRLPTKGGNYPVMVSYTAPHSGNSFDGWYEAEWYDRSKYPYEDKSKPNYWKIEGWSTGNDDYLANYVTHWMEIEYPGDFVESTWEAEED